jgi:hypothetical protein
MLTHSPYKSTIPESEFSRFWRYRYIYKSQDGNHHILACYVRHYDDDNDKDGKSVAEWSLYHNGNEQPPIEQTCLTEDFHNMLDSYGWEEEAHEVVLAK